MKCVTCENQAHPVYGSQCEDCWANGYALRHAQTGTTESRWTVRGARLRRDDKHGDEYIGAKDYEPHNPK